MTSIRMRLTATAITLLCTVLLLPAQLKYRTFSQGDLAMKKESHAGKPCNQYLTFVFHNDRADTIYGLHITFTHKPLVFSINHDMHEQQTPWTETINIMTLTDPVLPGDSVVFDLFVINNKTKKTNISSWWWIAGIPDTGWSHEPIVQLGPTQPPMKAARISVIRCEPNGGNVLHYLYKHPIAANTGLIIGKKQLTREEARLRGWIIYKTPDRKYFPHMGPPRCFDLIANGRGNTKMFTGALRNPHVKKHDNHLLGELHALKLAVIANDNGITEPLDSTRLGDLIYDDGSGPSNPSNGLTLRAIAGLVDSALTYCTAFQPIAYLQFDTCLSRVNAAFDGPYHAISFSPLLLAGTHAVEESPYIHPNPLASAPHRMPFDATLADEPASFVLHQNYPNPFNPTTTISFTLASDSRVTVAVYNMLGQEVAVLLSGEELVTGDHEVEFDGSGLPSGIYFCRLEATAVGSPPETMRQVRKMALMK